MPRMTMDGTIARETPIIKRSSKMMNGRLPPEIKILKAVDGDKAHQNQMLSLKMNGGPSLQIIKRNLMRFGEHLRHLLQSNLMIHGQVQQMMMLGDLLPKRMNLLANLLLNKMMLGQIQAVNGAHHQLNQKKMMLGQELHLVVELGYLQHILLIVTNKEINQVKGSLYNASTVKRWVMDLELVRIQRKKDHALIVKVKVIWQKIVLSQGNRGKEVIGHQ